MVEVDLCWLTLTQDYLGEHSIDMRSLEGEVEESISVQCLGKDLAGHWWV